MDRNRDWLYRSHFDLPSEMVGEEILRADNQFAPRRVPVNSLLRPTCNDLRLRFDSVLSKRCRRNTDRTTPATALQAASIDGNRATTLLLLSTIAILSILAEHT